MEIRECDITIHISTENNKIQYFKEPTWHNEFSISRYYINKIMAIMEEGEKKYYTENRK